MSLEVHYHCVDVRFFEQITCCAFKPSPTAVLVAVSSLRMLPIHRDVPGPRNVRTLLESTESGWMKSTWLPVRNSSTVYPRILVIFGDTYVRLRSALPSMRISDDFSTNVRNSTSLFLRAPSAFFLLCHIGNGEDVRSDCLSAISVQRHHGSRRLFLSSLAST